MKKLICAVTAALSLAALSAIEFPYFSGFAGIMSNFSNDIETTSFAPELNGKMFFAGQFDFNGRFFIRSEMSVNTEDIIETGLFEKTGAQFKINELSFTFHQSAINTSHFISLFMGNYEPIGSDVFLQRQFGIAGISSFITESWNGLCSSAVYPFYGIGGSYVMHFEQPAAVGLYLYENENKESKQNFFNLDLRYGCGYSNLAIDFSAGAAFPHESEITETGTDVVFVVRSVTMHSGLTMLIGNRNRFSFFAQAGFSGLLFEPQKEKKLSLQSDNMYFFIEPRFVTKFMTVNFSIYSIPSASVEEMLYIHDTLGVNLAVYNDHISIQNVNFTFGLLATYSFAEKNFIDFIDVCSNIGDILNWDMNLYITPFAAMPLLGGQLKASVSANVFGFAEGEAFKAVSTTIGYKTQI